MSSVTGPTTSVKVTNTASLYKLWIPCFDAFNVWRRLSVLISEFPLHCDRWICFVIPQNTLGFHIHWRHFDTSRLCNCNITINTRHKILEINLSNGKKKYVCIPRSFLVINVCNQGKILCSPCNTDAFISSLNGIYKGLTLIYFNRQIWVEFKENNSNCYIWSNALYGAETVTLRKVYQKYLWSFKTWSWRRMENISWTNPARNEVTLLTNFSANEDFFRCSSDSAKECFSGCAR